MTDEITTADSGADQKPVDNTNISVTDFANRRLGQMTPEPSAEEESEPVVEEETEETPEEVIEETQEAEEGEPEVESASEDVLSQIDLDNASEEELRELVDKIETQRVENQSLNSQLDEKRSSLQGVRGRYASLEALQQSALGQQDDAEMEWLQKHNMK